MASFRFLRIAFVAPLLIPPAAFGYIRLLYTDNNGSTPYFRPDANAIQFFANDQIKPGQVSNATGSAVTVVTPGSDPVSAIKFALAQWNSLSRGNIKFLPVQTTGAGHSSSDFQAVITFASTQDLSVMGYSAKSVGALGLTVSSVAVLTGQLSNGAKVNRGDIIDSDILLNSSVTFSTDASTPYDLQGVLTHELGHALGLDHSGLLGATMFPFGSNTKTPFLNQRLLNSDDRNFLTSVYPQGSGITATVKGRVVASDASPVKAALVTLVDTAGDNFLQTITAGDGTYSTPAPAGSYMVYAEPINGTGLLQAANFYSVDPAQVTSAFQPAILGGIAAPTSLTVGSGSTVSAPDLTVAPGTNALSGPFVGFGAAGGSKDIGNVFTISGPKVLPSGQSVDIGFVAGGFDGTENILILGQGISVRAASVRLDKGLTYNINSVVYTMVRATIDVPARQTTTLASIFVSKPSGALVYSGYLVVVPPTPTFVSAGAVSAASAQWVGGVSPGGLSAIYDVPGNPNLGPADPLVNAGYDAYNQLPGNLGGVTVTFDGTPAPLVFVAGGQINLQVPFEVAGKPSTQVVVTYNGSSSAPVSVPVADRQPAFFMLNATDPFAANADYGTNPHPNSAQNPAARGSVFSVYGTGIGKVSYDVPTGAGAPAPAAGYTGNYHCVLGSKDIGVPFAGWTPTAVGLAQWSFIIPADSDTGAVSLQCISIGSGASTQKATVYIK